MNSDEKNSTPGIAPALARGLIGGIVTLAALYAVGAALVASSKLSEGHMGLYAHASALPSALVCGITSARRYGKRKLPVSLAGGCALFLIISLCSLLNDAASFPGRGTALTLAFTFSGGALGGIFSASAKGRHVKKRKA
ncbi:MAG: TIGR04086 family membrane protein [Oscillospiraceae bacterium]|jgi:putative membrane protein (TIGR04086 family)|nr:TIGR04086 family membrane protein [Oscillospiraceae bacterium]